MTLLPRPWFKSLGLLGLLLLAGAAIARGKIAEHKIFADDGEKFRSEKALSFAVIGNTRGPVAVVDKKKSRVTHENATAQILADLAVLANEQKINFLVHAGDGVASAGKASWEEQDRQLKDLVEGSTGGRDGQRRVPIVPVAGESEYRGDRLLKGFGEAFPNVGADIGFNRVGTWYSFDLEVKEHRWRMLVLDTNKKALGPRWQEQLYWIPKAVGGDDFDSVVVFMHHPVQTLAEGREQNFQGAPAELIDAVEDGIGLMKLRAVFTADPSTTEVFMVGGRYGTLFFNAGGGGAPADRLHRWGLVPGKDNREEALKLETVFDVSLLKAFNKRASENQFPEKSVDEARSDGAFKGFPGVFDSKLFPVYGYWNVTLDGAAMTSAFRLWGPDAKLTDVYQVDYNTESGWKIGD